jgi:L,D-transpeptidase ErfK/SrfK
MIRLLLAIGSMGLGAVLSGGCALYPVTSGPSSQPISGPTERFPLPPPDEAVIGQVRAVIARGEDTLPDIARRFDLGYDEIIAANPGVDPWLPGAGTRVILPTQHVLPAAPREGLVLNLATMRLFYYPPDRDEIITHPIGIGREGWATPQGHTKVVAKRASPAWYVPASVRREHAQMGDPLPAVVPPGPDNPLGSHVLRLGLPSYLIHGTNKPQGVGMRVSHGCVRLYPEDIAALYEQVPVGTRVTIVNQPYLAGWRHGHLYLEAHPPLAEQDEHWRASTDPLVRLLREAAGTAADWVDWERAVALTHEPRGIPVSVLSGTPGLERVLATAPVVRNEAPLGRETLGAPPAGWYVQLNGYARQEDAQRMARMLSAIMPELSIHTGVGHADHHVLTGPYADPDAARLDRTRIARETGSETRIVAAVDLAFPESVEALRN